MGLPRLALGAALVALLAAGCDDEPPLPDPARDQALIRGAAAGALGEVERLLDEGADVTATDAAGRTALVAAAYGNHLEVARALVGAGADVNHEDDSQQSAFLIATSEVGDDPRLLELTLGNGADVDAKDSYDGTGLIRAADRGFVRIVRRLLDTDMDVDHVNRLDWTALLEAVILGDGDAAHTEVVRLLVEKGGADVTIADGQGSRRSSTPRRMGTTGWSRSSSARGAEPPVSRALRPGMNRRMGRVRGGRFFSLPVLWLMVGLVVAGIYDYFENLDTAGRVLSLIVAVIVWPLLLFGFDVSIARD